MTSYNINHIFLHEKIYKLGGRKFESDFSTSFFLTMISCLIIYLEAKDLQCL